MRFCLQGTFQQQLTEIRVALNRPPEPQVADVFRISIKSPKFILKHLFHFIHYNLAPINLITLTCMIICSLAHIIYTLLCFHFSTLLG